MGTGLNGLLLIGDNHRLPPTYSLLRLASSAALWTAVRRHMAKRSPEAYRTL